MMTGSEEGRQARAGRMTVTVCPACGAGEFGAGRLIDDFRVKTCRGCGLRVLIEPGRREEPATPEFSRISDAEYHRAVTTVRQRQAAAIISLARRHRPRGDDWLDIGCSFGAFLAEVRRQGFNVFGVEPDGMAFEHARRLLGDEAVRHGPMRDDTRPNGSADVVSMLDVLEHIPATALPAFACLIHRKLRPGGLWLLKVPSTEGLYFQIAHRLRPFAGRAMGGAIRRLWQLEYEFPHAVYFSERSLSRYLRRHGFQPVETMYLEEVPNDTVRDRLRIDGTISSAQARVLAPALRLINWIERRRAKSDAMVMLARRVETVGPPA
jgi:SAM-dependent methyltransferase